MSTSSYTTILTSAKNFLHAQNPLPTTTSLGVLQPNTPALESTTSPTFTLTFGHSYFTSTVPSLQQTLSLPDFIAHQSKMTPLLATWRAEVKDIFVDVERATAIVRSEFHMTPRVKEGVVEETVVNEIVWFLEVDGEGKVGRATEWVDAAAAGRLRELFSLNA